MSIDRTAVMRDPSGLAVTTTYTGTAGSCTAFNSGDTISCCRIWCTTDAYVTVGAAATATATNGVPLQAYESLWLPCKPGDRVSAIQITAGGSVYAKAFV